MAVLRLHAESRKHAAQVSQPDLRVTPASQLSLRGELTDNSVLFVGRTGAGKSSLINLLHGAPAVSVAEIASATRALEAISCQLGARTVTLVDSPGVGEVGTHADYEAALCRWYEGNAERISAVVLVIQADAKAHADDKRLLEALLGRCERPLLIVLSQVDKLAPTREPLATDTWRGELRACSLKSRLITRKLTEISRQFGIAQRCVVPVAFEGGRAFNRRALARAIVERLRGYVGNSGLRS